MRNDRNPKSRLGSLGRINGLRGPGPSLMDYSRLATLQRRLDALENVYSNYRPYDERFPGLIPRVARIAPMLAEPRQRHPPVNFQRGHVQTLGVTESIQELSSPDHAANGAATTPARNAAIECIRASLYAPKRNTSYSTTYSATTTTNTPTYTTPINMAFHHSVSTFPPYYSIASTSSSIGSTITFPSTTANGATTNRVQPRNFQAFCRNKYNAQEYCDEEMDEQPLPCKMAKRSKQHVTVVSAEGSGSNRDRNDDDDTDDDDDDTDDEMMDCFLTK